MPVAPPGAPGKDFSIEVLTSDAVNPRVVIDGTDLAGVVTFDFPAGCTTAGRVATCPAPPGSVDNNASLIIPVRAAPGARAGAHGTVEVRGDADNPGDGSDLLSSSAVITVASDGPDLSLTDSYKFSEARAGDWVNAPMTVTNVGNRAVKGIRVTVEYTTPLDPKPYGNCEYGRRNGSPERGTVAVCDFARRIDPGAVYRLDPGFQALVTDAAMDDEAIGLTVAPLAGAVLPPDVKLVHRGGRRLPLVPVTAAPAPAKVSAAADFDAANNDGGHGFTVDNLLDIAAVGDTVAGASGDTVQVSVGVRNLGGAIDLTRDDGKPAAQFSFMLPDGTEVTKVPANCELGEPDAERTTYLCKLPSSYFDRAATFVRTFTLRMVGPHFSNGRIHSVPEWPVTDENFDNDYADVTVAHIG